MSMGVDGQNFVKPVSWLQGEGITKNSDKEKAKMMRYDVEILSSESESESESEWDIVKRPDDSLSVSSKRSPSLLDRNTKRLDETGKCGDRRIDVQATKKSNGDVENQSEKETVGRETVKISDIIECNVRAKLANSENQEESRTKPSSDSFVAESSLGIVTKNESSPGEKSGDNDALLISECKKFERKCKELKEEIKTVSRGSERHHKLESSLSKKTRVLEGLKLCLPKSPYSTSKDAVILDNAGIQRVDKADGESKRSEQEKTNKKKLLEDRGLSGRNPYGKVQAELQQIKDKDADNRANARKESKKTPGKTDLKITTREKVGGSENARNSGLTMRKESKGYAVRNGSLNDTDQLRAKINDHKERIKKYDSSESRYKYHQEILEKLEGELRNRSGLKRNRKPEGSAVKTNASNEKKATGRERTDSTASNKSNGMNVARKPQYVAEVPAKSGSHGYGIRQGVASGEVSKQDDGYDSDYPTNDFDEHGPMSMVSWAPESGTKNPSTDYIDSPVDDGGFSGASEGLVTMVMEGMRTVGNLKNQKKANATLNQCKEILNESEYTKLTDRVKRVFTDPGLAQMEPKPTDFNDQQDVYYTGSRNENDGQDDQYFVNGPTTMAAQAFRLQDGATMPLGQRQDLAGSLAKDFMLNPDQRRAFSERINLSNDTWIGTGNQYNRSSNTSYKLARRGLGGEALLSGQGGRSNRSNVASGQNAPQSILDMGAIATEAYRLQSRPTMSKQESMDLISQISREFKLTEAQRTVFIAGIFQSAEKARQVKPEAHRVDKSYKPEARKEIDQNSDQSLDIAGVYYPNGDVKQVACIGDGILGSDELSTMALYEAVKYKYNIR